MIDPMSIGTAWTVTKEIFNTGKRIFDLKVNDEVRKEVQSMMDKTSLLYDRIALLEEQANISKDVISDLQEKIKQAKNFKREFKKYKPHVFVTGSFVYIYDDILHKDKPMHYICANCVCESIISILQPSDKGRKLVCHKCNSYYEHVKLGMNINSNAIGLY